jgi:hypothetical protein
VTSADDTGHPSDLRIGAPERETARLALETHLIEQRLNAAEHERRLQACDLADTRSELLRIFHDLPAPHPDLPAIPADPPDRSAPDDDDDIPPAAVSGCILVGLGIPVAIVLGFVYGAWWTLAVPVFLTAVVPYLGRRSG